MSDPADKSNDLMAELAKLMAAPAPGAQPSAAPAPRSAPIDPFAPPAAAAPSANPAPTVRIPGMPTPAAAAPSAPHPEPRAPVVGAIRIPGMDQPAPVSTSAPVSKFDFGKPVPAAAPIKQEPLSTLSERLAAQNPSPAPTRVEPSYGSNPTPQPTPIRLPSDLKPVSENKSFAQGPALSVNQPPAAPAPSALIPDFDFGFGRNPPKSDGPIRPTAPEPANDLIGDLIAAEIGGEDEADLAPIPQREARPTPPPVAPVARTPLNPQPAPAKPVMAPIPTAAPRQPAAPVALKPVSVAPRAPEADRFAVSPGAGLNMRQQPAPVRAPEPAPRPSYEASDPMSEIESLIGEAVRVELAPPGPTRVQAVAQPPATPRVEFEPDLDLDLDEEIGLMHKAAPAPTPAPAPTVPPLTSPYAPRRTSLKDKDDGSRSAEDAILAAAAATGAEVDRLEPSVGDESPYRRLKVKPVKSSGMSGGIRQYVGMAVAGTLLLAAGLGLYWVLNMGRGGEAATGVNAPQLTADATPVKEIPEPTAPVTDTARSPVLEQMGGTSVEPSAEQLVTTDETVATPVTRDVTQTAAADTEGGLANRKVRTVTVRPDGTIVSGDDAVAGAEELPIDRPNVPEVPATEDTNLLGDSTQVAMTDPVATNDALSPLTAADATETAAIQPVFNTNNVAPTPMSFPVRTTATAFAADPAPASGGQVTGAQTPNGQIDLLGGGDTQVAAAQPTPTPVSSGNAAAYVQLSSSPSEADAQSSLRAMNNRYGSLFGGNQLTVQAADLGQKGTWYRVRLPVGSLGDAQSICSSIKANGGDCIVSGG